MTEQMTPAKMENTERKPRRMGSQRSRARGRGAMAILTEEADTPAELMATQVNRPDMEEERVTGVRVEIMTWLEMAVTSIRYEEAF